MDKCIEIERVLKNRSSCSSYVLKPNESAKAVVWKQFSLVFQKQLSSDEGETLSHVNYLCACNKCFKVYSYKGADGSSFGTKNLLDHTKHCRPMSGQKLIEQCLVKKLSLSQQERESIKKKLVGYCVDGYQSFRAVEHRGLHDVLQTFVDLSAKYGKFDVTDVLPKRQAVADMTMTMANQVSSNE